MSDVNNPKPPVRMRIVRAAEYIRKLATDKERHSEARALLSIPNIAKALDEVLRRAARETRGNYSSAPFWRASSQSRRRRLARRAA